MIFENPSELRDRISCFTDQPIPAGIVVLEDTSEFMSIQRGTVLRLEGIDYYVTGNAKEGRFGIDEEPKFWVKYGLDLATGERKVIKLVFHENFTSRLGNVVLKYFRNPEKEGAILKIVRGHPHFMQGVTVRDEKQNPIRVLDIIRGDTLFSHIVDIPQTHEEYFFQSFPRILRSIIPCVEAIGFLNEQGQHHGDIRNDHIVIECETGLYRWIDFDYQVNYRDYDLWSIGNVLIYAAGKGTHSINTAEREGSRYPMKTSSMTGDDAILFFPYRVANLKKLYPYIPTRLNDVLLRFSSGAKHFYETFRSQVEDLREALSHLDSEGTR